MKRKYFVMALLFSIIVGGLLAFYTVEGNAFYDSNESECFSKTLEGNLKTIILNK